MALLLRKLMMLPSQDTRFRLFQAKGFRLLLPVAMLAAVSLLLSGACGGGRGGTGTPGETPSLSGNLTVFAASSLTDAFTQEKQAFEVAYPGVSVTFNFAGSPTLRIQLDQGARADVLVTADRKNMDAALQSGLVVDAATTFARNKLAVIVPKSNPGNIMSPFDLAKSGLKLVLAQRGVPAGDYARQIFQNMEADPRGGAGFANKVLENLVSEEANVKAVVTKVQLGEADAGIVYVTDVTPDVAGDVMLIEIPDSLNVIAAYPIATTSDAGEPEIAKAFIKFILSAQGQQILEGHGFLPAS
jgi:molybdate transport system substrate-binding protein